jgi:hypothetical protein
MYTALLISTCSYEIDDHVEDLSALFPVLVDSVQQKGNTTRR